MRINLDVSNLKKLKKDEKKVLSLLLLYIAKNKLTKLSHSKPYTIQTSEGEIVEVVLSHSIVVADAKKGFKFYIVERGKEGILGEGSFGKVKLSKAYIEVDFDNGNLNFSTYRPMAIKISELRDAVGMASVVSEAHIYQKIYGGNKSYQVRKRDSNQLDKSYMVIPFFPGVPLNKIDLQSLTFQERVGIALAILRSLRRIHKNEIVHCDIKPANIIYDASTNTAYIVDFSLSKFIWDGNLRSYFYGTLGYAPPEIFMGKAVNTASDIFPLAAVFGELFGALNVLKDRLCPPLDFIIEKIKTDSITPKDIDELFKDISISDENKIKVYNLINQVVIENGKGICESDQEIGENIFGKISAILSTENKFNFEGLLKGFENTTNFSGEAEKEILSLVTEMSSFSQNGRYSTEKIKTVLEKYRSKKQIILDLIEDEIERLMDDSGFFSKKANDKINLLKDLKQHINDPKNTGLKLLLIIEEWENKIVKSKLFKKEVKITDVINKTRSFLNPTKNTHTYLFIKELKTNFGEQVLSPFEIKHSHSHEGGK